MIRCGCRVLLLMGCVLFAFHGLAQTPAALKAAAAAGNADAAFELSSRYRFGADGLPANPDSARHYLRTAALAGHPDAQYLWGLQLLTGEAPSSNRLIGLDWLEKAADQNQTLALGVLMRWYGQDSVAVSGTQKPAGSYQPARALAYARRAATVGDAHGACFAGLALFEGRGAPQSDSLAVIYMTQAAHLNHVPALQTLTDWYLTGATRYGLQPVLARKYALQMLQLAGPDIETRTHAKVGLHRVEQTLRLIHNSIYQAWGYAPGTGPLVPIRR
jgi:TPR repeat protein